MVYANDDEPTFMTKVVFLMSMGNWSVSHPRSGEPVFASTEPNMPNLSGGGRLALNGCGETNGHLVTVKKTHADAMTMSCS